MVMMEDDDQACSTCKDHNRTAAHYTKVSSRAIIRMIFHARRQETSLGVLVKGLCGTVRPDLGLSISNTDIQCIIHLWFVSTKIFLLIWAFPCHIQTCDTPPVRLRQKCSFTLIEWSLPWLWRSWSLSRTSSPVLKRKRGWIGDPV